VLRSCARALSEIPGAEIVQQRLGERAAQLLSSEVFDVLISDIRMPGTSGLDLLQVAHQQDPGLPVILITGFPTAEISRGCHSLGAAACLVKPIPPEQLIATVRQVLDPKRARQKRSSLQ
jgi:two-component system C4-dicarboxylate transport response regulator DctD